MILLALILFALVGLAWSAAVVISIVVTVKLEQSFASAPHRGTARLGVQVARIGSGFVVLSAPITFFGYFTQDPETRLPPSLGISICLLIALAVSLAFNLLVWRVRPARMP